MRIAFVMSSLKLSGGVLLVSEYANRLAARGHEVTLVTPACTVDPPIAAMLNASVDVVEAARGLPERRTSVALFSLAQSLDAAIPPADVVIATHTPTVLPVYLHTRSRKGARRVWLYMDYPAMFAGRGTERLLLDQAPRFFDHIFTISQPLTDYVQRRSRTAVTTIRAGLSRSELFFDQPRLDRGDGRRRVLYVGDMRPRKGLREFLVAAEQVDVGTPNLRFVIAAKEPCTIDTGVDVEFHLAPDDDALAELYRSSALFVSASWGEGLGYPPLEAMACGTPVVLTDSSGVRDYARSGVNCLMVPPQEPAALAAAIQRLLDDPALAATLVQAGRATAARYNWDSCTTAFESALISVCRPRAH